jgi:hypothetical protein
MRLPAFLRDWTEVLAATWLLVAIGGTLVFGPHLGLRGWAWLSLHHVLCGIGVAWELRQALGRARLRREMEPGRRITP